MTNVQYKWQIYWYILSQVVQYCWNMYISCTFKVPIDDVYSRFRVFEQQKKVFTRSPWSSYWFKFKIKMKLSYDLTSKSKCYRVYHKKYHKVGIANSMVLPTSRSLISLNEKKNSFQSLSNCVTFFCNISMWLSVQIFV